MIRLNRSELTQSPANSKIMSTFASDIGIHVGEWPDSIAVAYGTHLSTFQKMLDKLHSYTGKMFARNMTPIERWDRVYEIVKEHELRMIKMITRKG